MMTRSRWAAVIITIIFNQIMKPSTIDLIEI